MTIPYPIWSLGLGAAAGYVAATCTAGALNRAGVAVLPQDRRYGCIDGLRGYLALSVFIFHLQVWMKLTRPGSGWSPDEVHLFSCLGAGSVGLFFMITGFLFYPRVLTGFRAVSWPATYIGRFFRIVPMTLVSVLMVTSIAMARTGTMPDHTYIAAAAEWLTGWKEPPLLGYAEAGRTNCFVLWTLWYEWIFYIVLLPLCALISDVMRGRLPSWLLPAGLLAAALIGRHMRGFGGWPTFCPLFAIGMLGFECQRHPRMRAWLGARAMALPALACLIAAMLRESTPYGEWQLPLFGFFFLTVACGNDLGGVLSTRGARMLGECSFGIYLLHAIVLSLIFVEGAGVIAHLPLNALPLLLPPAAAFVTCACVLLHVGIEQPAMQAGHALSKFLSRRGTSKTGTYSGRSMGLPPVT